MKLKIAIVLFISISFLSCSDKKKEDSGVFFGGQIVNPSSNFVRLYRDNKTIDSLLLNENFRFQKKYDSLDGGIYKLEHIPEYQSVFLEKGDSIWVRINAATFKESIVYSGKGSVKNNFLMEVFLQQERENDFLSSKYSNSNERFNLIIDSLLLEKKDLWIEMDSMTTMTPIAQKITQAAYIYPYATKRERYALLRGTYWSKEDDSIFFDYRKFLNYGDNDLALFDPYINYLMNYINEKALDSSEYYFQVKQNTAFNIRRLNIIDQEISGSKLRNILARAIAFGEILNFDNHKEHDKFLQYYAIVNSSQKDLKEVLDLHMDISGMQENEKLPNVPLQKVDLSIVSSNEIISDQPTVIYFWSQTQMKHYKSTLDRVEKFRKKYPKYQFVGICIQPFNRMVSQVQNMIGVDTNNQYAIVDFEMASKKWVLTLLNRGIIIDTKGAILEGFGNFSDEKFEKFLADN